MTRGEWWQVASLLTFAALALVSLAAMRRQPLRAVGLALLTIALNNAAYYFYIMWLREWLGIPHSDTLIRAWGAVRNLHLFIIAGGALLIFEYRWKSG